MLDPEHVGPGSLMVTLTGEFGVTVMVTTLEVTVPQEEEDVSLRRYMVVVESAGVV